MRHNPGCTQFAPGNRSHRGGEIHPDSRITALIQIPLKIARAVLAAGGAAPVVLNAANEVAVAAFLEGRIGFAEIVTTVDLALQQIRPSAPQSIADVIDIDFEVRKKAREIMPLPAN